MNYKTFLTCNKYIHFTKAKERSILTGNADRERKKYCLVSCIAFSIVISTTEYWTLLVFLERCFMLSGVKISKQTIESLKICTALYVSPHVNHLRTSRSSSNHRVCLLCVCLCVCASLARVSAKRWAEAVSGIFFFFSFL